MAHRLAIVNSLTGKSAVRLVKTLQIPLQSGEELQVAVTALLTGGFEGLTLTVKNPDNVAVGVRLTAKEWKDLTDAGWNLGIPYQTDEEERS